MESEIILDCSHLLQSIWQIVYLFGWTFLQTTEETCRLVPTLSVYEWGVATTSIVSVLVTLYPVLASESVETTTLCGMPNQEDNAKDEDETDGINPALLRPRRRDNLNKTSTNEGNLQPGVQDKLSWLILGIHFFWLLYGSFTFYPVFFIYQMYDERGHIGGPNRDCKSPIHFWFYILHICTEWFLVAILLIWSSQQQKPNKIKHRPVKPTL